MSHDIRSQLIRIAYQNPEIRADLLPIIQDDVIQSRMIQAALDFPITKTAMDESEGFWHRMIRSLVKQFPQDLQSKLHTAMAQPLKSGDPDRVSKSLSMLAKEVARENDIPFSVIRGIKAVVRILPIKRLMLILSKGWDTLSSWVTKITDSVSGLLGWGDKVAGGGSGAVLTIFMIFIAFCLLVAGVFQAGWTDGGWILGLISGIFGTPLLAAIWQNAKHRMSIS